MRRFLAASLSAVLLSSTAMAADLAVKAPLSGPPPPTWTGFYIGGNIGYSWGEAQTDFAGSGTYIYAKGVGGNFPDFPGLPTYFAYADSNKARLDGIVGGGQIGYNIQLNRNWLLGIETDLQASGERGTGAIADISTGVVCGFAPIGPNPSCTSPIPLTSTALTSYEARIDWFGTLRGRIGLLANDQFLIYGTGGLAYGNVSLSGTTNSNATFAIVYEPFTSSVSAFNASKTKIGYAVGAGAEGSIWLPAKWRWKVEYLYLDLGSLDAATSFSLGSPDPLFIEPFTGAVAAHARFTENILRVGVNYGF